jgi:CDP-diacylglycerol---glycerol-3-phosphate 3-phosphatidyltransferase
MFTINVPNVLTLLRILLVPVLVVALLDKTSDGDVLAAIVFALASFTDAIDGYIARSRNAITTFGKLMDPVADKLLIIAALFSLVSLDRLPAAPSGVVIAANWWGKIKTIVQVATIFFLIAISGSPLWLDLLTYAMVAITVVSGVDYFFGLRRLLREAEERRRLSADVTPQN